MKAWVCDSLQGWEQIRPTQVPAPEPGPNEIQVRVRAAGLNPVDYKLTLRGHPTWTFPHVLGVDAAGDVIQVGDACATWKPGDRVFFHADLRRSGTFAEFVVVPAAAAAAIPDSVSYTDAAALPCAGFTAWTALFDRLRIASGQRVLVIGGAGGVGGFAIQLASAAGCWVDATCSPPNHAWVQSLGARRVFPRLEEGGLQRLQATSQDLAEGGFDAILDLVSAESAQAALCLLRFGGGLAAVAGRPDWLQLPAFTRAPSVHEIALGAAYSHGNAAALNHLAEMGHSLVSWLAARRIQSTVREVIRFDEIRSALGRLATRRFVGKCVAVLD